VKKNFLQLIPIAAFAVGFGQVSSAQTKTGKISAEFVTFLTKLGTAQVHLQNGKAEAFKGLWSLAHDITLFGGFGGNIEKGWSNVGKRLDWVGKQFSKGTNKIERLVTIQSRTIAYIIQLEHISFTVPEAGATATLAYRVTMIFRREKNGWRIIHRQADSNMTKQAQR
jgi:ketosteroid isomerase-like protein